MKILYIHQYFKIPIDAGGTRSYWIARELIARGHEVIMLTERVGQQEKVIRQNLNGIDVISLKGTYNQGMTIPRRLKAFLGFMLTASKIALQEKNIDLVFATSTPLTVGIPALICRWVKKIPYVFEVRDLWPEVPVQMGALNNSVVRWSARLLEETIYKNANHVVALSPGMQDGVTRVIDKTKTSVVPNMSKIDEFYPREKNIALLKKYGLRSNTFKVVHFGAMGLANGIDTIIQSADLLKNDPTVDIVFIGGGSQEVKMKKLCEEKQLKNVQFIGNLGMKELSELVNACDVSLVSFKDIPILYTNSPNKMFDSLSAAKPIIVNSAGWTKDIVEREKCGFYVNPQKPQELVEKIKLLQSLPELVAEMGGNSRRLAEEVFDKTILCPKIVEVIERNK